VKLWCGLGAALAVLLVAACGGGGDGTTEVVVSLTEWKVTAVVSEASEGKFRFKVINDGTMLHEFVVAKSDLPLEGLPVKDGKLVEEQVNIVDEIEPFGAGTTESITLNLSPGKYLLLCNIVELPPGQPPVSHYQNGMVALFLLEPN
jgi:uncharacterized cupredoxin-like copper-binding protein